MSELNDFDRRQTLYEVRSVYHADGTLDKDEGREGIFETLDEALERAKDVLKSEQVECVVYECRPLYLVEHGRMKVTSLNKKATR